MFKIIIKICAQHPISVLMFYSGLILFGIVSLFHLNIEFLPNLNIPEVNVITEYSGFPAQELENLVTIPLENSLSSVKGVKSIRSVTKIGISSITLRFEWNTNIEMVSVEIREKIDSTYPYLPHAIKKPIVYTKNLANDPVMTLAVVPVNNNTIEKIGPLINKDLKTRLLQISGVSNVSIIGADEPEIKIAVDPYLLYAANLPLQSVSDTIQSSIFEFPTGIIRDSKYEYLIKTSTNVKSIEDIRNIPILSNSDKKITLKIKDIATVSQGVKLRTSFFHNNGNDAIGIDIYKTGNTGTLNLAMYLKNNLHDLNILFKNDFRIDICLDSSIEITSSITNLIVSILIGFFAAFFVLYLFNRSLSLSLITIITIPISTLIIFFFMFIFNISINIISLSGIAMGIGMIVDNSIVVQENLINNNAKSPENIAIFASEMIVSTFGSTITTLLVFLPILFIPGITGVLFSQLAITISILLITSFFLSTTLTPALYSLLINKFNIKLNFNNNISTTVFIYHKLLVKFFKKPIIIFFIFFIVLSAGIYTTIILKKEILPEIDNGFLKATIEIDKGLKIEHISQLSKKIELSLIDLPYINTVYAKSGYDRLSIVDKADPEKETNIINLQILLKNKLIHDYYLKNIKNNINSIINSPTFVTRPDNIIDVLLGSDKSLSVMLIGESRKELFILSETIANVLFDKGLINGLLYDTKLNSPEISLTLDRISLSNSGLNVSTILENLQLAVQGAVPAKLTIDEEEIEIRVSLDTNKSETIDDLYKLLIPISSGYVSIKSIGNLQVVNNYNFLKRFDRKDALLLIFIPKIENDSHLKNYFYNIRDKNVVFLSQSAIEKNNKNIFFLFVFAIIIMYLILGAQFESFSIPLLLLLSLPVSAIGSFLLLFILNLSLNINSFFGILILLGTTINTSIILYASYKNNNLISIINISKRRLNPILATTFTTIFALLPIILNPFPDAQLQKYIAISICGGLLTGTFFTLFFIPLLYYYIYKK